MKIVCNNEESKQVCQIINDFDKHRETYIKVFNVELTKGKISNRIYVGAPLRQV
jgi:translation initiation factor 6 (eIF-6)